MRAILMNQNGGSNSFEKFEKFTEHDF